MNNHPFNELTLTVNGVSGLEKNLKRLRQNNRLPPPKKIITINSRTFRRLTEDGDINEDDISVKVRIVGPDTVFTLSGIANEEFVQVRKSSSITIAGKEVFFKKEIEEHVPYRITISNNNA